MAMLLETTNYKRRENTREINLEIFEAKMVGLVFSTTFRDNLKILFFG
jgi:hypothetical protein